MTGFTLSPRIRGLGGITLHRLDSRKALTGVFPSAGLLLTGTVDVELIRSQWDEASYLAASLKYRHVTVSWRLPSCTPPRGASCTRRALVGYGGLQHALYYLVDEAYRRRITRQLNSACETTESTRRSHRWTRRMWRRRRRLG